MRQYELLVIGVSAGGMEALEKIIPFLPGEFMLPIVILQHLSPDSKNYLAVHLDQIAPLRVKEAEDKENIVQGTVYIGPANYHLLIEDDHSFSLSGDEKVSFARPSIDVLFETAADVYREHLVGIILTGANEDGSDGLKMIQDYGGLTIVQNPAEAEVPSMPNACLRKMKPDYILSLAEIKDLLLMLQEGSLEEK